jgi:hypothetical protein
MINSNTGFFWFILGLCGCASSRLPVMNSKNDGDNMIGIITDKDILRTIVKPMSLAAFAGEDPVTDQMQLGYRFLYDKYVSEDNAPNAVNHGI